MAISFAGAITTPMPSASRGRRYPLKRTRLRAIRRSTPTIRPGPRWRAEAAQASAKGRMRRAAKNNDPMDTIDFDRPRADEVQARSAQARSQTHVSTATIALFVEAEPQHCRWCRCCLGSHWDRRWVCGFWRHSRLLHAEIDAIQQRASARCRRRCGHVRRIRREETPESLRPFAEVVHADARSARDACGGVGVRVGARSTARCPRRSTPFSVRSMCMARQSNPGPQVVSSIPSTGSSARRSTACGTPSSRVTTLTQFQNP